MNHCLRLMVPMVLRFPLGCLLGILLAGCTTRIQSGTPLAPGAVQDDLRAGVSTQGGKYNTVEDLTPAKAKWTYRRIFRPQDIPLPATTAGVPDAHVQAVYSPSVVRFNNQYVMIFGVSIGCRGNTVARDSVAVAVSKDGINFKFERYLIEPNASTCLVDPPNWAVGTLYQVNDPAAYVSADGKNLYVTYTTVFWRWPNASAILGIECGALGLSIFRNDLSVVQRQDMYLAPTTPGNCVKSHPGFSRPDIEWGAPGGSRVWVDMGGNVRSLPLANFGQLSDTTARDEGADGLGLSDVHVPLLDPAKILLIGNSAKLVGMSRPRAGGKWTPFWHVTDTSGQGWDTYGQGSPWIYLNRSNCDLKLYMSGTSQNDSSGYVLNIGMAIPQTKYRFPVCN